MALKKPKIAIVAASAPPLSSGGVASAHYNLFRGFKRNGYKVKLFTFLDTPVTNARHTVIVRNGARQSTVKFVTKLTHLFFKLVDSQRQSYQTADILKSSLGALRMGKAITKFSPHIVILSDHGAPGLWVPKKPGQKFILVSHHNPSRFIHEPRLGGYSTRDARLAVWLENRVLKKVDSVICPSNYMKRWFVRTYHYGGPVSVIPNLVDLELIKRIRAKSIRSILGLPNSSKIVYLPSAGAILKGAEFVPAIVREIAAKATYPLVFYVPGEIEPELKNQLLANHHNVYFYLPGQLDYKRNLELVKGCDIGISPALMENFSMAILESAALGVPMLAFDRGGNKDIIESNKNGYLVRPFEVKELSRLAIKLLASRRLAEIRKTARVYTLSKFRPEQIVGSYLRTVGAPES